MKSIPLWWLSIVHYNHIRTISICSVNAQQQQQNWNQQQRHHQSSSQLRRGQHEQLINDNNQDRYLLLDESEEDVAVIHDSNLIISTEKQQHSNIENDERHHQFRILEERFQWIEPLTEVVHYENHHNNDHDGENNNQFVSASERSTPERTMMGGEYVPVRTMEYNVLPDTISTRKVSRSDINEDNSDTNLDWIQQIKQKRIENDNILQKTVLPTTAEMRLEIVTAPAITPRTVGIDENDGNNEEYDNNNYDDEYDDDNDDDDNYDDNTDSQGRLVDTNSKSSQTPKTGKGKGSKNSPPKSPPPPPPPLPKSPPNTGPGGKGGGKGGSTNPPGSSKGSSKGGGKGGSGMGKGMMSEPKGKGKGSDCPPLPSPSPNGKGNDSSKGSSKGKGSGGKGKGKGMSSSGKGGMMGGKGMSSMGKGGGMKSSKDCPKVTPTPIVPTIPTPTVVASNSPSRTPNTSPSAIPVVTVEPTRNDPDRSDQPSDVPSSIPRSPNLRRFDEPVTVGEAKNVFVRRPVIDLMISMTQYTTLPTSEKINNIVEETLLPTTSLLLETGDMMTYSPSPSMTTSTIPTLPPVREISSTPTVDITTYPSIIASVTPTSEPTTSGKLTDEPSGSPTIYEPSSSPTYDLSGNPTIKSSVNPSIGISIGPTYTLSINPSDIPTTDPTSRSSVVPSKGLKSSVPTGVRTITSSDVPSDIPTNQPPVSPTLGSQYVILDPYSMAFSAPLARRKPSRSEYKALNKNNMKHWNEWFLNNTNLPTGIQIISNITIAKYNAGIPDSRFNIYMEFVAVAFINETSSSSITSIIPDATSIFIEMKQSLGPQYIFLSVRSLSRTPFVSTNEVFFKRMRVSTKIKNNTNVTTMSPSLSSSMDNETFQEVGQPDNEQNEYVNKLTNNRTKIIDTTIIGNIRTNSFQSNLVNHDNRYLAHTNDDDNHFISQLVSLNEKDRSNSVTTKLMSKSDEGQSSSEIQSEQVINLEASSQDGNKSRRLQQWNIKKLLDLNDSINDKQQEKIMTGDDDNNSGVDKESFHIDEGISSEYSVLKNISSNDIDIEEVIYIPLSNLNSDIDTTDENIFAHSIPLTMSPSPNYVISVPIESGTTSNESNDQVLEVSTVSPSFDETQIVFIPLSNENTDTYLPASIDAEFDQRTWSPSPSFVIATSSNQVLEVSTVSNSFDETQIVFIPLSNENTDTYSAETIDPEFDQRTWSPSPSHFIATSPNQSDNVTDSILDQLLSATFGYKGNGVDVPMDQNPSSSPRLKPDFQNNTVTLNTKIFLRDPLWSSETASGPDVGEQNAEIMVDPNEYPRPVDASAGSNPTREPISQDDEEMDDSMLRYKMIIGIANGKGKGKGIYLDDDVTGPVSSSKSSRNSKGKGKGKGKGDSSGGGGNIVGGGKGKGKGVDSRKGSSKKLHCFYYDPSINKVNRTMSVQFRKGKRNKSSKQHTNTISTDNIGNFDALFARGKGASSSKDTRSCPPIAMPSLTPSLSVTRPTNVPTPTPPSSKPTPIPPTSLPTRRPSNQPTPTPPSSQPTPTPPTSLPTGRPSKQPAAGPTIQPSLAPSIAATSLAPSSAPSVAGTAAPTSSLSPTAEKVLRVYIPRYAIAMDSPNAAVGPTEAEFNQVFNLTTQYFTLVFASYYANNPNVQFLRLSSTLNNTGFNLDLPRPIYNIYMDYNTTAIFTDNTTEPDNLVIFDVMKSAINETYVEDYVKKAGGPFAKVNLAFYGKVQPSWIFPSLRSNQEREQLCEIVVGSDKLDHDINVGVRDTTLNFDFSDNVSSTKSNYAFDFNSFRNMK